MKFLDQGHKVRKEELKPDSNPENRYANSFCNSRLVHVDPDFSGGVGERGSGTLRVGASRSWMESTLSLVYTAT